MKRLLLFTLLVCSKNIYAEDPMQKLEVLKQFEGCYEVAKPAEEKSHQAFVWFSNIPDPFFNAVMHLTCDNVSEKVDALIQKVPQGNPLSFWVHPQNRAEGLVEILKERGFQSLITCPLMAWKVQTDISSEGDIRPADMEIFYQIMSSVYQFNQDVKVAFEKFMENVDCENYLIYEEGKPVGTVTFLVNGSVAGIFNDATLPERREAHRKMMQFLMQRAQDLHLKQVIVLSSPEAEQLYTNLGFRKAFDIEVYAR
jgi:hypothetical protein